MATDNEINLADVQMLTPVQPVEAVELPAYKLPEAGIALCLSGGGYRAMLFHLGALWRLNELGYLSRLERISSVSGGSITAACLGMNWSRLAFDGAGVSLNFRQEVVEPVRDLANRTLDTPAVVTGVLGPGSVGDRITTAYRRHLYGQATLRDLPYRPMFIINATNVQSGGLWRFSRYYMADYRVGRINQPELDLAVAVAASAAFPPFLSPVRLSLDPAAYVPNSGRDLHHPPFTTQVILTDGGVYDNLGLETAWKNYQTILVSDGGGATEAEATPDSDWARHTYRVLSLINHQVTALRKRQVIGSFELFTYLQQQEISPDSDVFKLVARQGAYWGIRSDISNYRLDTALSYPAEQTLALADIPTRLRRLEPVVQKRLINWGYAICDAAMRKHVDPLLPAPAGFPYPEASEVE